MFGFDEKGEYVPESKENSRKTEKRTTLKGKKERKPDADNLIKKPLYPHLC